MGHRNYRQALGLAAHLPPSPSPGWALLGVAGGSLLLTQRWQGERGEGGLCWLMPVRAGCDRSPAVPIPTRHHPVPAPTSKLTGGSA